MKRVKGGNAYTALLLALPLFLSACGHGGDGSGASDSGSSGSTGSSSSSGSGASSQAWLGSWAAAPRAPEAADALAPASLSNATLRQVVHLSAGGSMIRLRIPNLFGTEPPQLLAVHVALPLSPATSDIEPGSDQTVPCNGTDSVVIPPGVEYSSDPLEYSTTVLSDLSVTMQIDSSPGNPTSHSISHATSYLVPAVPVAAAALSSAQTIDHWYFLSGVDVSPATAGASIVTLGDPITDGECATTHGNNNYPDDLAARLKSSGLAVLNEGVAGNRALAAGTGPSAVARFDRDVLARDGVQYVILLEGINDIDQWTRTAATAPAQHQALVSEMIGASQ